jgi:AraC-like DNA-binding protein
MFIGGVLLGLVPKGDGPAWGHVMNEYDTYADIPRWLSLTTYLILTRRWLSQYVQTGRDKKIGNQDQHLRWLWQFVNVILVFQAIWLVHLVPYILPNTRSAWLDKFGWYPLYIPIAILIYWLGLKGYLHARQSPPEVVPPKVNTTFIPAETVDKAIVLLTNAMHTDKLYLDPELTVEKVGKYVQLPPKTVSFVVNQHLQKSFNAFVNEYRIEAVKEQLTNPANEHLTLTGIAFDCGFNSQATFQRAFRQATGKSPKQYIEQLATES